MAVCAGNDVCCFFVDDLCPILACSLLFVFCSEPHYPAPAIFGRTKTQQGSFLGALTGGKNVNIDIQLSPPPPPTADATHTPAVVPLDHAPSWRLHKNPFWRVKHPGAGILTSAYPPELISTTSNQMDRMSLNNPPQGYLGNSSSNASLGGSGMIMPHPQSSAHYSGAAGKEQLYAYEASEDVAGVVILRLPLSSSGTNKGMEHLGITVQFIGRIDMSFGSHEGRPHYDFISLSKELSPPGALYQSETVLPFKFKNMDKELESYRGRNVAVRYIIKVQLERKFLPPVVKEHDVWVQLLGEEPGHHEPIKMEVGIEDCLHIEFEYERRHYHLQDTVAGQIRFLLVAIKLKHMELAVIRRETSGEGVAIAAAAAESSTAQSNVDASNIYTETQTLVKYEIMDGAPVKGEVIPVKLCLKGIPADLTPTYTAVNNRFSVRYFLNLVLVDEDDRRYFKQQEILLWRKELG